MRERERERERERDRENKQVSAYITVVFKMFFSEHPVLAHVDTSEKRFL